MTRDALEAAETRVSSRLLGIELRRLARRRDRVAAGESLAERLELVALDESLLELAEHIAPPTVATLDAIHLATAVALAEHEMVDTVLTYAVALAAGARAHGLAVLSP